MIVLNIFVWSIYMLLFSNNVIFKGEKKFDKVFLT